MNTYDLIPPDRLMDAVDAILASRREQTEMNKLPSELLGSHHQPAAYAEYTADEIREAERFLLRMGVLEAKRSG